MSHTTLPLRAHVAGLDLDYGAVQSLQELAHMLLWVAEQHELLDFLGDMPGGYVVVVVHDRTRVLQLFETPGYVLALFDAAGLDASPVAYRLGVVNDDLSGVDAVSRDE